MSRKHRPHRSANTSRNGPVVVVSAGLTALTAAAAVEARRRCGGNATRVQVVSPTAFIVWN